MKRTKRYNGDDDSLAKDDTSSSSSSDTDSTPAASASPASFSAAFKAARASGDKTFTYNGKSYTTELASDKKATSKPSYTPPSNRFGQPGGSISDAGSGRDVVEKQNTKTPVDMTKLSLAERAKISRENIRQGSGNTDTRSVNERIRSAFGMKKGGATKKMASGGSVSSASNRADGIAQRGKTKGKMC